MLITPLFFSLLKDWEGKKYFSMCLAIMVLERLLILECAVGTFYLTSNWFYHLLSALITFFFFTVTSKQQSRVRLHHAIYCANTMWQTTPCPTEPSRHSSEEKENTRQENLTLSLLMKLYMCDCFSLQTCIFDSHHLNNSYFPLAIKCYDKCTEKAISCCV